MNKAKGKVFVGLSGGVDSSVSAAILKKRGFDVTGIFIKVWQPDFLAPVRLSGGCTWKEDRLDAMRVAAHLDIPFITLDLEKEYKKEVVDHMIEEYRNGRTPNPDVMCNKYVKFGAFLDYAISHGADYVATGHYARVHKIKNQKSKIKITNKNSKAHLLKGVDSDKDQSYFLWTLTQRELSKTFFPIGEYAKPEVRKLAEKFGLPTAQKKDSQGLCFIGRLDMRNFLKEFIKEKKGDVLNESGEVIGMHDGAFYYTIGQRHGFRVTDKGVHDSPYYVSKKDIEKNTITVAQKKELEISAGTGKAIIKNTNWTSGTPEENKEYTSLIRYRGDLHPCKISIKGGGNAEISFEEKVVVSSGQSLVLYDGDECLGGGVVEG